MVQIALLALAGLYDGDYLSARYRIPNNRQTLGSVQVKTLYAVRQKNGRIEYSEGDTEAQTCVRSLFPHLGYTPCWYLSRHATQRIEIVRVDPSLFTSQGFTLCRYREGIGQKPPRWLDVRRATHALVLRGSGSKL